jgi:hypothetical protein
MRKSFGLLLVTVALGCGHPTGPTPPPPPTVGPATPPVIQSIAVPTSRVEAGQDITITATVTDAETPLSQLTYLWAASAGTITGTGSTVTWQHPTGIKAGVDVVITLTVVDRYQAVDGNVIVEREFRVVGQSQPFRVHDSPAETRELARRFLVDLFGNSSLGPAQVLVDFSDTCYNAPNGKKDEANDVIENRQIVVIQSVTIFSQSVSFTTPSSAIVHSDTQFMDKWIYDGQIRPNRDDFVVTAIYETGRWWLCQSYIGGHGPASRMSFTQALLAKKRLSSIK